jgi:hypothetical protein
MSFCFAGCFSPGPRKNDLTIYWALGPFVRSFTLLVDPGDIYPLHSGIRIPHSSPSMKITLTRISNSATDERVQILETRGKEMQLYNTTTKCLGPGGRERHMHVPNKLLQQNQASPVGGAAPSASSPPSSPSPPSARSASALDGDASGRISTSKEDASIALGPTTATSNL